MSFFILIKIYELLYARWSSLLDKENVLSSHKIYFCKQGLCLEKIIISYFNYFFIIKNVCKITKLFENTAEI